MKIIVVIGGIGSGKSTVSKAFRDLGAAFIDLDVVGHDILLRDDLKRDLVAAFGPEIIGADGKIYTNTQAAVSAGPRKIVIKRPLKGPFLAGRKPDYSITGKTIRYDCLLVTTA